MSKPTLRRSAGCFIGLTVALFAGPQAFADVLTLNGGGVVRGNIVAAPAAAEVAMRTRTGGLIVFERNSIQQIQRVAVPLGKSSARQPASTSTSLAKSALTADEKVWVPKVRSLAGRLFSDDPNQSRRARADLLRIVDPEAISALKRSLRDSPSEPARRLYVAILRDIPGPEAVDSLVLQSIYDPSPAVRADARHAIGPNRAEAARRLYIECLRAGAPDLAGRAARGLGEIGDPHRQSVPYLIEALVEQGTQDVLVPGETMLFTDCLDEVIEATKPKVLCVPRAEGRIEVLDALVKITDQPALNYGYNVVRWRRWWSSEGKSANVETARTKDTIGR